MNKEPWDLPVEESSRPILLALIEQYEAAQQARELGICCARMAHLLKQVGPFSEASLYGQKAVFYLRQTDDKKELSRALRWACLPFDSSIDQKKAYLEESLALAREIGAKEQEAATIYQFTRAFTPSPQQMEELNPLEEKERNKRYSEMRQEYMGDHTIEEALAIYEEIGYGSGIAMCLVSLGAERKPSERALFDRAIALYEEAGETEAARKAKMMADTFAPLPRPWELPEEPDSRAILSKLIEGYRESNQRRELAMCLWRMSNLSALFGSIDPSKTPISYARESLVCFRQSVRGTEYCLALEQAAKAAPDHDERLANLEELVSYSEEICEPYIHGRALFALVTQFPKAVKDISGALEFFEDIEDEAGIAACKALIK